MFLKSCRHGTNAVVLIAAAISLGSYLPSESLGLDDTLLDVNDVSFLWPIPKTEEDVDNLISIDFGTPEAGIVPESVFLELIKEAKSVAVDGVGIVIPSTLDSKRHNWKVVGVRVNPTSLGTDPAVLTQAGIVPSIRLIVQPVEVINGNVKMHDFAAHVVFNFITNTDPPFQPDKTSFAAVVKELQTIKEFNRLRGVQTSGAKLGVHPGFASDVPQQTEKLKVFLKNHLNRERLQVISFMGIPGSFEPWIFFKVHVLPDGTLVRQKISGNFGDSAPISQMLAFQPSPPHVSPKTIVAAQALGGGFGISTAVLFERDMDVRLDEPLLSVEIAGQARLRIRDIPDLIANPMFRNTLNTDCVSCHTETTRRAFNPRLTSQEGVAFVLPQGISGVEKSVLPTDSWNVRDFGWGFNFGGTNKGFHPTISQRAANEAAQSADFINREIIREAAPPNE